MPHATDKKRKESSRAVERTQEFRVVHFPDRPLKRAPYAEIPSKEHCESMLVAWRTGKVQPPIMRSRRTSRDLENYENQSLRHPPIMRRRRTSRDLKKETECMNEIRLEVERREHHENYGNQSLRQRRGIQTELTLDTTCGQTAEDGFRYRIVPEPQHVSQPYILPRTTYNPQSMTKTSQPLPDVSPSPIFSPTVYTSPSTRASSVHPQNPALPLFTCPLCRSQSRDNHDGLCNTCKAEFTMSASSSFYEDDESILHSSACFPQHLASKSRCSYSSSVYSQDTSSTDDRKSTVSPILLDVADDPTLSVPLCWMIGDENIPRTNRSGPASYQNQNRRASVEKEQLDLYDLDWADYYFDR
ncbi:hypothetical protein J3E68DRAFT_17042 [Trichoderma sp. SZMC 28012]